MKQVAIILLAGGLAIAGACAGCRKSAPPPPPPKPVVEKNWTPEEIAADAEGYLVDQDRQVARHIDQRNSRLASLTARRADISKKSEALQENMQAIQNVNNRMGRALRQAEDEDRWPVQMGGRTFTRERAAAILKSCQTYLDDRKPLAAEYDAAVAKLDQMDTLMKKEIQDLGRLREQLAISLERVRLNKGLAEMGDLRKTQTELASFAKQLGQMDENVLDTAAAAQKEPPKMDVETLLK